METANMFVGAFLFGFCFGVVARIIAEKFFDKAYEPQKNDRLGVYEACCIECHVPRKPDGSFHYCKKFDKILLHRGDPQTGVSCVQAIEECENLV